MANERNLVANSLGLNTETLSEAMVGQSAEQAAVALKRVLLVTEHAVPSAPIYSLGEALERIGVTAVDGNVLWSSTRQWLNLALRHQVVVFVYYRHDENLFFQRQIYRARMLGCAVVRWWVGSDVMWARESKKSARAARELDQAVDLNIAVSPHLVEELAEIGLDADYVPSPCNLPMLEKKPPARLPKGVLTYLPGDRKAFYGEKVLQAAIAAHPDIDFYVVSDETHSLSHYPNVHSLGWVKDMEPVWDEVGLLLRVTEHDGMPRMVLEALARGRYVIYSERFNGCWYAKTPEEALHHLSRFRSVHVPNKKGPLIARSISEHAGEMYAQKLAKLKRSARSPRRLMDMVGSVRHIK